MLADAGNRQAGADRAVELVGQAIADHADTIVDGWIAAVQGDCDTLTGAADQLSDIGDLHSADPAALKNGGLLPTWSKAIAAYDRIDLYATGLRATLTAMGVTYPRPHMVLAYTGDTDVADAVLAVTTGNTAPDCWTVAATGAALQLANATTFRQRTADYSAELQRRYHNDEAARTPTGFDGAPRREAATL